ncbi:MAG TPA: hypothetical protein VFW57_09570 [Acidimicrobiia bacterium]|nr:hypothetical protein [Acidimicrobiia bacterium]
MTSKIVQDMIVERRLDKVGPNAKQAGLMLRSCMQHLETADQRAGGDPSGCYALLYDATRKAVAAHMLFHGLRVTSRPGAHAAVVAYAEAELAAIGGDHLAHLDRMRRTRNDTEYEERPVTEAEVRNDLVHARFLVQAITRTLFPPKKKETR